MAVPGRRDAFYLWLALGMTATAFVGFWFTYFGPLFRGAYPQGSPLAHVHGWSFFAWYLLLPLQAGLIQARRAAVHRTIGLTSIGLGVIMIGVGLIVSVVRIDMARGPEGDPFWRLMGVPIFAIWVLFTVFYVAAIGYRRRPAIHRRYIVLASAVPLAAATFRILVRIVGFSPWAAIAGCLAPIAFVLAALAHDYRRVRSVSPVYVLGTSATAVLISGAFLLVMTGHGELATGSIGRLGQLLRPIY